jgi:glucose-6-phosphate 1-dehydrogenase
MDDSHSDALVFFGATGDLAYKQIFPALQALVKRHNLDIPIVGGACRFGLERKSASASSSHRGLVYTIARRKTQNGNSGAIARKGVHK